MKNNSLTKREYLSHNVSRVLLGAAVIIAPITAFASYTQSLNDVTRLAIGYFNQAIYVIIALAVVSFIWNVYHYFFKADLENKKDAGLYVMYSVIGFFVIISIWGLVSIISNTLNLNTTMPGFGSTPYGSNSFIPGAGNGTPTGF